jgi:hypothetical protein
MHRFIDTLPDRHHEGTYTTYMGHISGGPTYEEITRRFGPRRDMVHAYK